jgi:hypothetical protein
VVLSQSTGKNLPFTKRDMGAVLRDESVGLWEEAEVTCFKEHPGFFLEGLRISTQEHQP